MGKRRRNKYSETYRFTPNESYNISEQVMQNEEGNSVSSDPPYYEYTYIKDNNSRRAIQQSEHCSFTVQKNMAYNESQQNIEGPSSTGDDEDSDYVISSYSS